ncbi:MAG: dihydropteroate synthase [Nitrospiraceae bacterium]|nr:dihydropteroate synthase [Nitrospiraceae bacterium]
MSPERISRLGALTIRLTGLTDDETAALRRVLPLSGCSGGPGPPTGLSGAAAVIGTPSQVRWCAERLAAEPVALQRLGRRLQEHLTNFLRTDFRLSVAGRTLDLGGRTHIMGILNVTPDSFSDGGQFGTTDRAVIHAREMARDGADIIDIGGESTRPGAAPLPEDEELRRIIPVIKQVTAETALPVSVDTYKAPVARKALEAGAAIVNDISGLRFSPDMARVVADHGAAVVLMHIKGTPRDMQQNPVYDDVVAEILGYLEESIGIATAAGIPRDRILIDPGIGFGKTVEHNLAILARLDEFRALGCPIVLGTSRKRFIGTVLGITEPRERIEGTAATVALGIERGAHVLRVHDVRPMVRVARMTDAIVKSQRT